MILALAQLVGTNLTVSLVLNRLAAVDTTNLARL